MRRTPIMLVHALLLGLVLLTPGRVRSEPFLDLYGGVADTQPARVTVTHQDCVDIFVVFICAEENKATRKVAFDPSATFGMRGGYWFDSASWVGVAADVSFFEAEANHIRFRIVPVSLLVMLRVPLLVTDEIPGGRLQPYIGILACSGSSTDTSACSPSTGSRTCRWTDPTSGRRNSTRRSRPITS